VELMMTQPLPADTPTPDLGALYAKLDAIDQKLDYVVARQEFVEEMIDEMIPVGKEALASMVKTFAELEAKGYFAMAKELYALTDRVVTNYGPEEVHRLAENIVLLLDTVRNFTQPDVLEIANDAADVLHHADDIKPVGMFGVVRASGDTDVQRGMGVALEILKHLGRAQGGESPARTPKPAAPKAAAPKAAPKAAAPKAAAPKAAAPKAASLPNVEPSAAEGAVTWQGKRFTAEGFLLDTNDWSPELGAAIAEAMGLTLSDEHWTVINWTRNEYLTAGASANVRRIAAGSGVGTRRMYELFPKSPGKTVAMVAGIPKPVGCV
jgi:tRNA 2-thiouridine synthesizing protein E